MGRSNLEAEPILMHGVAPHMCDKSACHAVRPGSRGSLPRASFMARPKHQPCRHEAELGTKRRPTLTASARCRWGCGGRLFFQRASTCLLLIPVIFDEVGDFGPIFLDSSIKPSSGSRLSSSSSAASASPKETNWALSVSAISNLGSGAATGARSEPNRELKGAISKTVPHFGQVIGE